MKKISNKNYFRIPALFVIHFMIICPLISYLTPMTDPNVTAMSSIISGALVFLMSWIPPVNYFFLSVKDGGTW